VWFLGVTVTLPAVADLERLPYTHSVVSVRSQPSLLHRGALRDHGVDAQAARRGPDDRGGCGSPRIVGMTTSHAVAAAPWVERLARIGYAAKAVLYITVGLVAARAGLGRGGRTVDTQGALRVVHHATFGRVALG
jgi:hypothetical protein